MIKVFLYGALTRLVLAGYWLGEWFFWGVLVITAHFGCLKNFKELMGFSKNMKKKSAIQG